MNFIAAHKIAVLAGVLGAVLLGWYIHHRNTSAAAAGVAVDPYSSTPPSTGVPPGDITVPQATTPYGEGGSGPGPNTGASTSTGPGAGPTVAQPNTPPDSSVAPAQPDLTAGGTPTSPGAVDVGSGPVATQANVDYTGGFALGSGVGSLALGVPTKITANPYAPMSPTPGPGKVLTG